MPPDGYLILKVEVAALTRGGCLKEGCGVLEIFWMKFFSLKN